VTIKAQLVRVAIEEPLQEAAPAAVLVELVEHEHGGLQGELLDSGLGNDGARPAHDDPPIVLVVPVEV